jgi:hypothetical protein
MLHQQASTDLISHRSDAAPTDLGRISVRSPLRTAQGRMTREVICYTRRTWVVRKARCDNRARGQGTPTSRRAYYVEEA